MFSSLLPRPSSHPEKSSQKNTSIDEPFLPQKPSVHFIAIGGIGMQSLGLYCKKQGWHVQGSDCEDSETLHTLRKNGIKCFLGHKKEHVFLEHNYDNTSTAMEKNHVDFIVYSSAIKDTNPEYQEGKHLGIPVIHRSDLLSYWIAYHKKNHYQIPHSLEFLPQNISLPPQHNIEQHCFSTNQNLLSPGQYSPFLQEQKISSLPLLPQNKECPDRLLSCPLFVLTGTHGKTTTTALLTHILEKAGKNPLGFIGGKTQNIYMPQNPETIVVEGDESDGSHTNFSFIDFLVVTNIDNDHLDYYENNPEKLKESFRQIFNKSHNIVLCSQDKGIEELYRDCYLDFLPQTSFSPESPPELCSLFPHFITPQRSSDQSFFFYGLEEKTPWGTTHDFWATNIRGEKTGQYFDIYYNNEGVKTLYAPGVFLPLWGHHNILNTLGVITAGHYSKKVSQEDIVKGLKDFSGVERRMTPRGSFQGVPILDDYAHHPTEIRVLGQAIKQRGFQNALGIFEPHRYTRLTQYFQEFLHCFQDFAGVIVLPLYGAHQNKKSNNPTYQEFFHQLQQEYPHKSFFLAESYDDLPKILEKNAKNHEILPWDVLVFMGAGHSSDYAKKLGTECP